MFPVRIPHRIGGLPTRVQQVTYSNLTSIDLGKAHLLAASLFRVCPEATSAVLRINFVLLALVNFLPLFAIVPRDVGFDPNFTDQLDCAERGQT